MTPPATNVAFTVADGKGVRTVFWNEDPTLSPRDELKAAWNLAAAGDETALRETLCPAFERSFAHEVGTSAWTWSPLALLDVLTAKDARLVPYCRALRTRILDQAEKRLRAQEAQPYRLPRWNGNDLAWGRSHPLVNARYLVAAHALTGDRRYLAGAYLAYDYQGGCNPDGMTLTSGLGEVYPVRFLSLQSTADAVGEYVAGITPYRWTYGVGESDYRLVHSPAEVKAWPIWRRRVTLEALNVPSGEYTVWETIGPAAAVTAYLAGSEPAMSQPVAPPHPRGRPEDQPGYWALP